MKEKLKKFKEFTQWLLPHEASYLLSVQQFQDQDKIHILQKVKHNAFNPDNYQDYDISIDKRKYSSLYQWIQSELQKVDVDEGYIWMSKLLEDILLDRIAISDENAILKSLSVFNGTSYFFSKYYAMLQEFRQYLLIRKRIDDYSKVNRYIEDFRFAYQRSLLVSEQMHQATRDILITSNKTRVEEDKWEKWLKEQFEDETLDGLNRYAAFVRLTFYYLKHNLLEELTEIYTKVHRLFEHGQYYSKRILLNYYDYLLVLFDRKKNYEKAVYYGNLAIKGDGPDQLIYLNNLINVYIKKKDYKSALSLIDHFSLKVSSHKNFHAVIGFIANQIRCLTLTGQVKKATIKARVFMDAFAKEILKYRWHRFFTAYLQALEKEKDYLQIIRLVNRYKLDKKEMDQSAKEGSTSKEIFRIFNIAKYNEGYITKMELDKSF
jgi:hypothetical protein